MVRMDASRRLLNVAASRAEITAGKCVVDIHGAVGAGNNHVESTFDAFGVDHIEFKRAVGGRVLFGAVKLHLEAAAGRRDDSTGALSAFVPEGTVCNFPAVPAFAGIRPRSAAVPSGGSTMVSPP